VKLRRVYHLDMYVIVRGCGWDNASYALRAARRMITSGPSHRFFVVGVRIAKGVKGGKDEA
jgi:hypothetical protein